MKAEYFSALLMILSTAAAYWLGIIFGRREGMDEGYDKACEEMLRLINELNEKDDEDMDTLNEDVARYLCQHGMDIAIRSNDHKELHIVTSPEAYGEFVPHGHIKTTYVEAWIWLIETDRHIDFELMPDKRTIQCTIHPRQYPKLKRDMHTGAYDMQTAVSAMINLIKEFDLL